MLILLRKPVIIETKIIILRTSEMKLFDIYLHSQNIERFPDEEKVVYLTFDGDNHSNRTHLILEMLKKEGIKATFFLTGNFMQSYPEDAIKILKNAHEIGNHTHTHPHLTTFALNRIQNTLRRVSPEFLFGQLYRTENLLVEVCGEQIPLLWRAPYGEENPEIRRWASRLGYIHIRWSYDFIDWKGVKVYQARLDSFLNIEDKRGFILLLHLGSIENDRVEFKNFLEKLIPFLKKEGYRFETVGEGVKRHLRPSPPSKR